MREANARCSRPRDAEAGARADDLFHQRLTEGCGNQRLLDVVRPLRQALMDYERVYFSTPERRARSAAQHGAIVDALERGRSGARRRRSCARTSLPRCRS